ncbi:MAG: Crp/Fnr family transcriptional regulator [Bacteroidetes bacterium]|nr:Crp/Fnr family transcriptional regulator [Bacteroidota bacterium]
MLEKFKAYLQKNAQITDQQFGVLSGYLKSEKVKKQTLLLKPGEICGHSFFVEKGLLRSYTIDDAGKEHVIQFAPEDWIVSDRSSAYFNQPSDFFIDAVEESEIVYLDNTFMNKAYEVSTNYRQFTEKALHNHIRHIQKRVSLLLGATAEQRYMDFIKPYPDLMLRVPQWMIASYLGITPESLSRVRKELAKKHFKPD